MMIKDTDPIRFERINGEWYVVVDFEGVFQRMPVKSMMGYEKLRENIIQDNLRSD